MHLQGGSFRPSQYLHQHKAEQTLPPYQISFPSHGWLFIFSLSAAEENNKSLILLQPDGNSVSSRLAGCVLSCACACMCASVSVCLLLLLLPCFCLPCTLQCREMVLQRGSGGCRYNRTKPLPGDRIHWELRRTTTKNLLFSSCLC